MKKMLILLAGFVALCFTAISQNVGIGTSNPAARLHVTDSSVVFTATGPAPFVQGGTPVSGAGRRTMWYADKAAFRTGYSNGANWDQANIGNYSFASGFDPNASGPYAIAMGNATVASARSTIAIGESSTATQNFAYAIGYNNNATGIASTVLGNNSDATAQYAMVFGGSARADGIGAMALGTLTIASGDYSTAMGYAVSTNGHRGALVIGDASADTRMNSATDNSFRARFDNGYRFYTSSDLSTNAYLAGGDNAWSTSSDVRKKENFEETNGEQVLKKIGHLHLGTWNYKNQNPKTFRHYGPMAQDFYGAFGKDKYGSIGNDTTINQADFNGLNMVAIEALEKRTEKIAQLEAKNKQLEHALTILQQKMEEHDRAFNKALQELKQLLPVKK